ncbi:MAG: hypothetical protein U1E26_11175 [Coriobacteriia bacterium]|nr:hypothetical protein [Coriobacteriia bacterium]
MSKRVRETLADIGWGIAWAALLVAVALFASGASDFIYVDF